MARSKADCRRDSGHTLEVEQDLTNTLDLEGEGSVWITSRGCLKLPERLVTPIHRGEGEILERMKAI